MLAYIYLIALWLLFGSTHSLFAAGWWKRRVQQISGRFFPFYRLSYSLFSFFILLVIVWYEWQLPTVWLWRPGIVWQLIAGVAALGGLAIMLICIWRYFFYLSGIDVLFPRREESMGLTTDGLNRYVRHPLYAGTLLTVWSCWLIWPELGYLISCCMITLYTFIGTVWEERKLRAEFGEAYRAYQQKVPMLMPFKW
ncbi:NnrU family protein [Paraflavitalea sp. CAU 1676]|uniref:methyltransferase family protein n=1 Tax=Paraflavitalea sp. CAU 1676 TaxID=3032598 RepID=UPI0023DB3655|nr:NnrU family protein [Paraflavitalea sp. CAU 1676]MDF2189984.1 NnrU family protein [Paraflavitalea sp. CAU 1676]